MVFCNVEKPTIITLFGNLYYNVMPFGLKNTSTTYQHAMTTIFHDMVHDYTKDYVDNIVVKSNKAYDHFEDSRKCSRDVKSISYE